MTADSIPRRTALIIAGGDHPGLSLDELPAADVVVAADSGLDHARSLRLRVDAVVGDLDSVSPLALEWANRNGVRVETHDPNKDHTDTELAMHAAVGEGCTHLVIVGGLGGRLDHQLATIGLLAAATWADCEVELRTRDETIVVLRGATDAEARELPAGRGGSVTLLAWGGPATGVTSRGLQWEVTDVRFEPGSTLGVSNVVAAESATVQVRSGVLLAVMSRLSDQERRKI